MVTQNQTIWFKKDLTLDDLNSRRSKTLGDALGIEFTEIGADFLRGTMPVDHRTKQPQGILHGGATAALAETLGSVSAQLVMDHTKFFPVGLEINANHIKSVTHGQVTGTARPAHIGKTTQVWEIKVIDEKDDLVSICRLTILNRSHSRI